MSANTWSVEVDGVRHTISVERNAEARRSMIRVDGKLAAKPMTDDEEEREVPVGSTRYVIRRVGDRFDLDVPPETFLNPDIAKPTIARRSTLKPVTPAAPPRKSRVPMIITSIVAFFIVAALLRIGNEGLAYKNVPWKPYAAEDGSFKVNFAGDPKLRTQSMNIAGDMWNITELQSRYRNHFYVVEYVDAHMVITEKSGPDFLEKFFGGAMSGLHAQDIEKEKTTIQKNPAITFRARIPKGTGEGDDKLDVDGTLRGMMVLRGNRIVAAWSLRAARDPISWDVAKFLDSLVVPPVERPSELVASADRPPDEARAVTATQPAVRPQIAGVEMATTVVRVYADNRSKLYYPADCNPKPEKAYAIARSLARSQGFKLAPQCTEKSL